MSYLPKVSEAVVGALAIALIVNTVNVREDIKLTMQNVDHLSETLSGDIEEVKKRQSQIALETDQNIYKLRCEITHKGSPDSIELCYGNYVPETSLANK